MTTEATSPSLAMENQKGAFFLGGLASIDPIFTQYPEVSSVGGADTVWNSIARASSSPLKGAKS